MDGFYLVDKPVGITSFDVLRKLKKILGIKKMGHTGTLDPLASGLLLVGVGNYTKLIPYFEKDKKEYEFTINLDGISPSFDTETEITFLDEDKKKYFQENLDISKVKDILSKNFLGKISQMPPKYSALKIGGKKALDMVRNGEEFELQKREVQVFDIQILDFNYPKLTLKALVSAGTYIRSIAFDLGEILQTGGYISYLRRTKIGNLDLTLSQTLDNFDISKTLSEEKLFDKNKFITLTSEEILDINNGKIIKNNYSFLLKDTQYFVNNDKKITNIIFNNGSELLPIRKI